MVDIGKADVLKNFIQNSPFSKMILMDLRNVLDKNGDEGNSISFEKLFEALTNFEFWQESFTITNSLAYQFLNSMLFAGDDANILDISKISILLFGIPSCQSDL